MGENVVYKKVASGAPSGETEYVKYDDTAPNTLIAEGIFDGFYDSQFGRSYYVRKPDGNSIGLNGSGKLRHLIEKANLVGGEQIRVTYLGKTVIEKGQWQGRHAHDFELEVAAS